jgi:hypothetical protein
MLFASLLKPIALGYAEAAIKRELERFGVERVHGLQTAKDGGFVAAIDLECGPKELVFYGRLEFHDDRITVHGLRCNVHWVEQILQGAELGTTRSLTFPVKPDDIKKIQSLFT